MDKIRTELAVTRRVVLAAGLALALSACPGGEPRVETGAPLRAGDSAYRAAATDSVLPMHVLMARFREGLPAQTSLEGGAPSLTELIERFLSAVERRDTATLQRLAVSRAEYAWLYFPTSVYAAAPYELAPEIAWMLSAAASEKGLTRLVRRLGGAPLQYRSHRCADKADEGNNRFWRGCTVEVGHSAERHSSQRLFGTVIEREGQYKFLSYVNDF